MISLTEARQALADIKAEVGDAEAAHFSEDELRRKVLKAIAAGSPHAQALAQIALATDDFISERWYA